MENILEISTGVMDIMDNSGHRQMHWNMDNVKEIAAVQKTFERLVKQGYAAFGSTTGVQSKQAITTFDPTMEEVVMVPRIVGG